MAQYQTLKVSQNQEIPVSMIERSEFAYRIAYSRSAESQSVNISGQDYLAVRDEDQIIAFALCDGIGSSYRGELAAKFLGDALINWLWEQIPPVTEHSLIRTMLSAHLQELTTSATNFMYQHPLPGDLPLPLEKHLKWQQQYGSQSMFVCGRIDSIGGIFPNGRIILAGIGDFSLRVWLDNESELDLGFHFDTSGRWSSKGGIVQPNLLNVYVSTLKQPNHTFYRVQAYSDGLNDINYDKDRHVLSNRALQWLISQTFTDPTSDDISFFEILLRTVPSSQYEAGIQTWQDGDNNTLDKSLFEIEPQINETPKEKHEPIFSDKTVKPGDSKQEPPYLEKLATMFQGFSAWLQHIAVRKQPQQQRREQNSLLELNQQKVLLTHLRLDAELPSLVELNRSFELSVAVRQSNSPKLKEDDLNEMESGDLQVDWPEDSNSVPLRIQVSAPECKIHNDDGYLFRLYKGQDSPVFYFQLTPKQIGRIGIVVTVYQEQEWLGGTRLHTMAQERVAGKVETTVYSRPIGVDHEAQVQVAKAMADLFDPSELRQLCFELEMPYHDLPGETHTEKCREMVRYMVRRGHFIELVMVCKAQRPQVNWEALAGVFSAETESD